MQPKILIVDDQPLVLTTLEKILNIGPYMIYSAQSGSEALGILEKVSVDLVISDERMPGMAGSQLLAAVRQRYPKTVRILLTGYASLTTAIRAINEGEIFRFLTKPIKSQELHTVIQEALAHKRGEDGLGHETTLMSSLERQAPGITQVKRDAGGCVIIDDEDSE